jgi:hypothetical protein
MWYVGRRQRKGEEDVDRNTMTQFSFVCVECMFYVYMYMQCAKIIILKWKKESKSTTNEKQAAETYIFLSAICNLLCFF